jgi:hypothetical protein
MKKIRLSSTSTPPQRFAPSVAAQQIAHSVDLRHDFSGTSLGFFCPLASQDWIAPLFALSSKKRPTIVALIVEGASHRVWLPSQRFQPLSNPWESFSTPNAYGLRPSKLLSSSRISHFVKNGSSALALYSKTPWALELRFSDLPS